MPETILFYSSRHGVGRSNIAANLTYLLAVAGRRVGIIDTDTKSPVTHHLFGLKETDIAYSFNDYLAGQCSIEQAAYDITSLLPAMKGQLFVVPANTRLARTAHELHETQDAESLNAGCQRLIQTLKLDALLIDAQPGVSPQSLIGVTIADILVVVLRLDYQDYQDTSVAVEIVRQLNIPRILLLVNEAPKTFEANTIKTALEKAYDCEVIAILPYVDEIMTLANRDVFVLRYPDHPLTMLLKEVTTKLVR
jgi:MinD-like ATPase involved in chromosome partitioning or flagellar assembly